MAESPLLSSELTNLFAFLNAVERDQSVHDRFSNDQTRAALLDEYQLTTPQKAALNNYWHDKQYFPDLTQQFQAEVRKIEDALGI